jgi:hypothetical protein
LKSDSPNGCGFLPQSGKRFPRHGNLVTTGATLVAMLLQSPQSG